MTVTDVGPHAVTAARTTRIAWVREAWIWVVVTLSFPLVALLEPGDAAAAVDRAERIAATERDLGFLAGPDLTALVARADPLRLAASVVYYGAHVPAVVALFVWLGVRRPDDYRNVRRMFVAAQVMTIGLYLALPTAPPRLVPSLGGTDPRASGAGWHVLQYEFAAVPSGHVIFAAIVGATLVRLGGPAVRVLGVLYPLLVVAVTVTTRNHFVTDALVGLLVVGIAVEVARSGAPRHLTTVEQRDWAPDRSGSASAPSPAVAPFESRSS
jgi:hypothetical protein